MQTLDIPDKTSHWLHIYSRAHVSYNYAQTHVTFVACLVTNTTAKQACTLAYIPSNQYNHEGIRIHIVLPPKNQLLTTILREREGVGVGELGGWIPHPKQRLSFPRYAPQVGRSLMVGVEPGCKESAWKGVCYALDQLTNMDW